MALFCVRSQAGRYRRACPALARHGACLCPAPRASLTCARALRRLDHEDLAIIIHDIEVAAGIDAEARNIVDRALAGWRGEGGGADREAR